MKLSKLEWMRVAWVALCIAVVNTKTRAETRGDLYAFCDAEWRETCNTKALMLKDVCENTVRAYTDGSARFSCAPVNAATRDAYLQELEPDIREKTFRAWSDGR